VANNVNNMVINPLLTIDHMSIMVNNRLIMANNGLVMMDIPSGND
jgi:hypothetical protein